MYRQHTPSEHRSGRQAALEVLQLDVTGLPQAWITPKEAALLLVTGDVAWYAGEQPLTVLRGGMSASTGLQSTLEIPPIIAVHGQAKVNLHDVTPALTNPKLFARDRGVCIWCAKIFSFRHLTRDHIVPTSRGGSNTWGNCGSACRSCNTVKGAKLASELGWELAYLPYVPSLHEDMILRGRNIRGDVHAWLAAKLPRYSRLH